MKVEDLIKAVLETGFSHKKASDEVKNLVEKSSKITSCAVKLNRSSYEKFSTDYITEPKKA